MGKWTDVAYNDEIVRKSRAMFKYVEESLKKDNPDNYFSFENFVEALDENDTDIHRWFELLVKETYKRSNRARTLAPYSSPPPAAHRLYRNAFLQSFTSTASSSDISNGDNDSDVDQALDPLSVPMEREIRERRRDWFPFPPSNSTLVERLVRRSSRMNNIPSELLDLSEFNYASSHVRSQSQAMNLPPPSAPSPHVYERLREFREREQHDRDRESIRRHHFYPITSQGSTDRIPSPSSAVAAAVASSVAAVAQRREVAAGNPSSEFGSYRRPPTTLGLAPPVNLNNSPSPFDDPPTSRIVIRRAGSDQRTDLRHYMREVDSMYLEHRDQPERSNLELEARIAQLEGFERERVAQGHNRDIEERARSDRELPSQLPTPPHVVTEGEGAAEGAA